MGCGMCMCLAGDAWIRGSDHDASLIYFDIFGNTRVAHTCNPDVGKWPLEDWKDEVILSYSEFEIGLKCK